MTYIEDVKFVGAMLRGGSWEVGLRIARRCTPDDKGGNRKELNSDRATFRRFADDCKTAGYPISHATVRKYFAAWEWAADGGQVDHAAALGPDDEYDFSSFPEDDKVDGEWVDGCWRAFYEVACLNPPPWNPTAKPLEPRNGPHRHIAKDHVEVTPEKVAETIHASPAHERAAYNAIVQKQAAKRERFITEREQAGIPRDVIDRPIEPAWKDTAMGGPMDYAVEDTERRAELRELAALAEQGKAKMQAAAARFGHTGVAEEVALLHQMTAALTDWQWSATGLIIETASEEPTS